MPYVNHPNAKRSSVRVRVNLPDPNNKRVLVVETDLPLHQGDPKFNQKTYDDLIDAIRECLRNDDADEAEIIKV